MYTSNQFVAMFVPGLAKTILACLAIACSPGCRVAADGQNLDGVRLYQQGQYQNALHRFQQAVASNPDNADAYYNMAATFHSIALQTGDQEKLVQAEAIYNQCLDIDENHTDCRRGLAVLLVETGRADRAFALLKNWAVANPQLADPRVELARLYEEFGDKETAKLHLNDAVKLDQHNARAWTALGRMREEAGDYSQALANYQRSYNLNNFQPAIAERIAVLNRTVGSGLNAPPPADTRMVAPSNPTTRY